MGKQHILWFKGKERQKKNKSKNKNQISRTLKLLLAGENGRKKK